MGFYPNNQVCIGEVNGVYRGYKPLDNDAIYCFLMDAASLPWVEELTTKIPFHLSDRFANDAFTAWYCMRSTVDQISTLTVQRIQQPLYTSRSTVSIVDANCRSKSRINATSKSPGIILFRNCQFHAQYHRESALCCALMLPGRQE